ncbi:MAG: oligosaccharide flippase family protein [Clostridia bacterium]|nr:oligosaccharide flippase family protein [Clostridia bacterium]
MANKSAQKIFNNSLLYSIGTIASKAVGFFLVPIYTNCMSTTEYGIATTIIAFVSTFSIVVTLSLRAALIRFYNEYDKENKKRFVGSIVLFTCICALVFCLIFILGKDFFTNIFFKNIPFYPYAFWGILALGTEGIYLIYQSTLQAQQNGKGYSINSIIYLLIHALAVVLFVYFLKMSAKGMIIALFTTNFLFAVYGIFSMLRKKVMTICLDWALIKKAVKYSLPILPHNLSNSANNYGIKLVISYNLTYALSGLYSLATQFSTIINLVQTSINLAFRPWFVEQMGYGKEGRAEIKKMSCMIMALYSFCAVGIAVFSEEIIFIMCEETYFEAWKMVPFLVLSQLISFVYYTHVQSLMYNLNWSKFTFVCSLTGVIVNVGVAIILSRLIGYFGIVVAQIISKITLSTITVIMSNKAENIDFGLGRMSMYIFFAGLLGVAGMCVSFISETNLNLLEFIIKIAIIGIAALLFIRPYRADLFDLFKGLLNRKRKQSKVLN